MTAYERAYDLFAEESKARVSEQQAVSKSQQADQQEGLVSITEYSFPTLKIEGDNATVQVVRTFTRTKVRRNSSETPRKPS